MPSITYTFRGDISPLRQASQKLGPMFREAGKVAGKEFGNQFKSLAMSFIGLGAFKSTLQRVVQDALRIDQDALKSGLGIEAFQELEKAAQMTGLSVKELQENAPKAAEEFIRMMEAIRAEGGIIDEKTVEEIADVAEQWQKLMDNMVPVVAGFLKLVNATIGVGQKAFTAAAAGAMALNPFSSASRQAGRELAYEVFNPSSEPDRITRSERRQAVGSFLGRVREVDAQAELEKQALEEAKKQTRKLEELVQKVEDKL